MNSPTTPNLLRQAIATGSLSILLSLCCILGISTQGAVADRVIEIRTIEFNPPLPPIKDAPGNRGGGGSRGSGCDPNSQPVMALIPDQKRMSNEDPTKEIIQVWGTTLSERPTFWFDVPDERSTIKSMKFVLQDSTDQDLYESEIVPPETPGIVSIRLPETVTALKPEALYHWFLNINFECPSDSSVSSVTRQISGWVQRVTPDSKLTSLLKGTTPTQRAILYAKNGIWFDALTTLGDLRRSNPKDASAIDNWNQLLQSVGLENLKNEPMVNCCKSKSLSTK